MEDVSPKLLLIDDEAGLRRSLRFGLAQRGIKIDDVEEGLPGLKLVEDAFNEGRPYRAIIADIQLPDINGLKLLEVLKTRYPDLAVIVISAYGGETTADEVRAKRGDAYLAKPFPADDLAAVVERLPRRSVEAAPHVAAGLGRQSVSAYALVKLRERSDAVEAFRDLYLMDNVVYCDAVHGEADVVLLLNANSQAEIDKILEERVRYLPDVERADCLPIVRPELDPGVRDFIREYNRQRIMSPSEYKSAHAATALSAYVFVEVEPGRLGDVFPKLYFMDRVVACDATEGACQLVLLVQAHTVADLDRVLSFEIGKIDGVVRTRTSRILNMFEM